MIFEVTEVRNAQSTNSENTSMDVEINHPQLGWIPYTINDFDPDDTISNQQLLSLIGSNYAAYVPPTSEEIIAEQAAMARGTRQEILQSFVDPYVTNNLRWQSMTDAQRQTISDYRQQLLDITEQTGWPQNVEWPTPPDTTGF